MWTYFPDAGDRNLFLNLEPILIQALPQESTDWRRSYGRVSRAVTLNAVFVPFSKDIFQKEDDYHLLKEPVLHIFWTQCAVSILCTVKKNSAYERNASKLILFWCCRILIVIKVLCTMKLKVGWIFFTTTTLSIG